MGKNETMEESDGAMNPGETYEVKCDYCKGTLRETEDQRESVAGGQCSPCQFLLKLLEAHGWDKERTARYMRDTLRIGGMVWNRARLTVVE